MENSTLTENGAQYLARHLRQIITQTEEEGIVELIGIGIGFDTLTFYPTSAVLADIGDLGTTLIQTLGRVLQL